jgi:hypothetical protein
MSEELEFNEEEEKVESEGNEEGKSKEDLKAELEALKAKFDAMLAMMSNFQQQQPALNAPQTQSQQIASLTPEQLEEYNRRFLENPVESVAKIADEVKKQTEAELRRKIEEEQRAARFWTHFRTSHPEFKDIPDDVFAIIIQKDAGIIASMKKEEDISRHLEKRAWEHLKEMAEYYKKAASEKRKPAVSDTGGTPFGSLSFTTMEERLPNTSGSLADYIRSKRAKMFDVH